MHEYTETELKAAQEKAAYEAAPPVQNIGSIGVGGAYIGGALLPASPDVLAEARERDRRFEQGQLKQAALSSAIQYAVGREVSSSDVVDDARRFLDFLKVE